MTLGLMNGQIPFKITSSGSGAPGPALTPAPSGVVLPEPAVFKGSIVYAKAGNIWIQTTDNVRQLTSSGLDSTSRKHLPATSHCRPTPTRRGPRR